MTSLDHIRTFAVVAQTGSLSGAARELGLSQPTVGRHIDLLEADLNIPLFTRGRDGMTLTDKGAELVDEARTMLAAATGFNRRAAGLEEDISGPVRLSTNEVFGVLILPRILPAFMARHPQIEVELDISNSAANLLQRDADIAIRMFRPTQNDLLVRKVADVALGFYAHHKYLAAHSAPHRFEELRQHRVIGFDRETGIIDAAAHLGAEFRVSDFAFRSDNILAHIEAIRAGVGIGVTHQGLAAAWPGVDRVLPNLEIPPLELWLACHQDVRFNNRIRLMMDFLAEALKAPYVQYSV